MTLCSQLKTEYAEIEDLKKEFETAFDEAVKTGKTEKANALKIQIQEKLESLKEKIVPREIKGTFINPETNEQKEIGFNVQEEIKKAQEFYQKHNLPIPNEQEIKKIFQKNKAEIQKEMETYGYGNVVIIPENLPSSKELNDKMTQGFEATYQSDNFKNGQTEGFSGAKTVGNSKARIILCHSDQNIFNNPKANPFAKATLNKSIIQLSGLTKQEIDQKIQNNENIPVNFETEINGKKIQINSEGLSLDEYLIFQRQYFEETKGENHLDASGYTWLPKTRSDSRFVYSDWNPGAGRLGVNAHGAGDSHGSLGCRLSRSFSA